MVFKDGVGLFDLGLGISLNLILSSTLVFSFKSKSSNGSAAVLTGEDPGDDTGEMIGEVNTLCDKAWFLSSTSKQNGPRLHHPISSAISLDVIDI